MASFTSSNSASILETLKVGVVNNVVTDRVDRLVMGSILDRLVGSNFRFKRDALLQNWRSLGVESEREGDRPICTNASAEDWGNPSVSGGQSP